MDNKINYWKNKNDDNKDNIKQNDQQNTTDSGYSINDKIKCEKEIYSDKLFYYTIILSLFEKVFEEKKFNFGNDIIDKREFIKENEKVKRLRKLFSNLSIISPMELYIKIRYEYDNKICKDVNETCQICLDDLYEEVHYNKDFTEVMQYDLDFNFDYKCIKFSRCIDHCFHMDCVIDMLGDKDFLKCPICSNIYGIYKGNQPDGTMNARIIPGKKCDSYADCDSIEIEYNISSSVKISGTYRKAYLPNNKEGLRVLGLFKVAFDRRLIFTIGTSVTTGLENQIVWNGIHHKSCTSGGSTNYGYPDPTYFERVAKELEQKGVEEKNIEKDPVEIALDLLKNKIGGEKN